jgi:hypothetical protein
MAEAASAQQSATATAEDTSQQRAGRRRRTSAEPQRAQQGATAAAAPAALDTLSRLQQLADASPQVAQLRRLQALADASPQAAQLRRLGALVDASPQVAQLQRLQALADAAAGVPSPTDTVEAAPPNRTGLSDGLKAGVESLSGLSMDHVRVHYNSAQPAQLNALAYAQGSDIHVAPGQEQHLPHEAWHVVQQAQGRVRPTMQMKDGVPVNDDQGLEHEADVMGMRAESVGIVQGTLIEPAQMDSSPVAQLGRHKPRKKSRHKKKPVNAQYGNAIIDGKTLTVERAVFFDRPPSNSRSGQGDHVVSYSLITQAVATSIVGKSLKVAGADLAKLVSAAKEFVRSRNINNWWHANADSLIQQLQAIDEVADSDLAKKSLISGINTTLSLLNQMPGTALKNKKSTKGHGEGGSIGGIVHTEHNIKIGKPTEGNVWTNVLNLFDGAADNSLMQSPRKLQDKLQWLMALFSRAAPTLYDRIKSNNLELIPGTNLSSAINEKFGADTLDKVKSMIEDWIKKGRVPLRGVKPEARMP